MKQPDAASVEEPEEEMQSQTTTAGLTKKFERMHLSLNAHKS